MAACKENLAHLSVIHLPVSMSGLNAHVSALLCCLTAREKKKEKNQSRKGPTKLQLENLMSSVKKQNKVQLKLWEY